MTEVHIITGPTCSGKTSFALSVAKEIGAEIISCDSVQIYKGMDIGSAKASAAERAEIPHHLIDVADCSKPFDVAEYIRLSQKAVADIISRGKKIIVCGGSGFYLRSWFAAVTDNVEIPEDVKKICDEIEKNDELAKALLKIDPRAAESIDIQNPRRAKNALARCMASGKSCAQLIESFKSLPCPMGELSRRVRILDLPTPKLNDKIRLRARRMVEFGLIEETKLLISKGLKNNLSAASAIGYRETIQWLENGENNTDSLAEQIASNTLSLVKKQRKYFRNALLKDTTNVEFF